MDRYISIKVILDDILDHPLLKDVSFERAINHTIHFMRIVGMPKIFEEKTTIINIEDYRGLLPCDLYKIIQVRTYSECSNNKEVFRYSTDNFHMSNNKQDSYDLTYKIQNSVIFTSMKEGSIELSYNAIKTDDDGYPMIPDNSSFIKALELYIKQYYFQIQYDLGKIQGPILQSVKQEYAWYVGQAQNSLIMPTIDEMESFSNSWNTLIPRVREHSKGFVNNGTKEQIKQQ